jgi:hypothetical protein
MVMKLTFENNKGDKVIVKYDATCITDKEVELDPRKALEPLWETLTTKISEEYEVESV